MGAGQYQGQQDGGGVDRPGLKPDARLPELGSVLGPASQVGSAVSCEAGWSSLNSSMGRGDRGFSRAGDWGRPGGASHFSVFTLGQVRFAHIYIFWSHFLMTYVI